MSEIVTTFCDFCNEFQQRNPDGRGYTDCPTKIAVKECWWVRRKLPDGTMGIMCPDCQDEKLDNSVPEMEGE